MRRQTSRLASGTVLLIAFIVVLALAIGSCGATPSSEEAIPVDDVFTPPTNQPTVPPSPTPTATPASSSERARSSGNGTGTGSGSSSGGSQAAPAPRPANVTCPSGSVSHQATTFAFKEHPISGSDKSNWDVTVKGMATNNTSHHISSASIFIDLRVPDTSGDSGTAPAGSMGPGQSANWSRNFQFVTSGRPTHDRVATSVSSWSWGDASLDRACPR